MLKKLLLSIMVLLTIMVMVACPPPTDTDTDTEPTAEPTAEPTPTPTPAPYIIFDGTTGTFSTGATLVTAATAGVSSGAIVETYNSLEAIHASNTDYSSGSGSYEIRLSITFDPAVDLSAYTTIKYSTNMSYNGGNLTLKTDDSANPIYYIYNSPQTGWYEWSQSLGPDWANSSQNLTAIEFYINATTLQEDAYFSNIKFE